MTVRTLLVTLDPGERSRRSVLYVLSRDPRIHVGPVDGNRLPVVTETPSPEEGEDLTEQLRQVPGVHSLEVLNPDVGAEVVSYL
ncbi:MAG: hypothetical protein HS104_22105 [Polyangiaceae bacterium]|nr:hypothetical protein [Polyangiaceae bacterium]MCE7894466.1 hypothetical protein [Sorangiineae bacterium PRO1]MCL4749981.1 hypothetical protein [Myxococcales bacterium]